jgi:4-oxalocrotonate tautomerase
MAARPSSFWERRGESANVPASNGTEPLVLDTIANDRTIQSPYKERSVVLFFRSIPPQGKPIMPMINVRLIEGVFTPSQKEEMIRKLTDAMVSIEGENLRPVTWVVIDEVKSGDWGVGGKPLTTNAVKELAAGKASS